MTQKDRFQKQLATWLRQRLLRRMPEHASIVNRLSDEQIVARYHENASSKVRMLEKKEARRKRLLIRPPAIQVL